MDLWYIDDEDKLNICWSSVQISDDLDAGIAVFLDFNIKISVVLYCYRFSLNLMKINPIHAEIHEMTPIRMRIII